MLQVSKSEYKAALSRFCEEMVYNCVLPRGLLARLDELQQTDTELTALYAKVLRCAFYRGYRENRVQLWARVESNLRAGAMGRLSQVCGGFGETSLFLGCFSVGALLRVYCN